MANPITSAYRFIRNILYGYPDYSLISRREFIRALVFLFLVRAIIMNTIANLFLCALDPSGMGNLSAGVWITVTFICATFYVPYFKIFYRRLVAIDFSSPRLITFIAFIFVFGMYQFAFPDKIRWYWEVLAFVMLIVVQVILLIWPDRIYVSQNSNGS